MINSTRSKVIYVISDRIPIQSGYMITFPYFDESNIKAIITDGKTEMTVDPSNYTVVTVGTVPYLRFVPGYTFPEEVTKIVISREMEIFQETDLANGEIIDAEQIELVFDMIVAICQQLDEKLSRTLMTTSTESSPIILPESDQRAGHLLGFDDSGKITLALTIDIQQKLNEAYLNIQEYVENTSHPELDAYVSDTSKPSLDTYVKNTSKPAIDAHVATKKTELDDYESLKETHLNSYTAEKKAELDSYVTDVKKPELDAYELEKENEIQAKVDSFTDYSDTQNRLNELKGDLAGLDKKFGKNKVGNLIVEYKESTYLPLQSDKVLTPIEAAGYTAYKLYVKGVNTVNLNKGIVTNWSYFTDENNNYITDFKVSEHFNKGDGYMVMDIPKDAVYMWVTRANSAIDLVGLATVRNITKVTVSDYQINTANFSLFLINQKYTANGNVKIVDANGFGDYVDIQSAIDDIDDDSFSNQYILLVMPGVYSRISMGTKLSDRVRYLSIIGLDKSTCVIRDDSGLYETPPFNAKGYGVYKNLTFYATHNDAKNSGWAEGVNSSYAMHYDFGSDVNMTFEDCYFYSEQQSAVGLGIWDNSVVKFKRCDFESKIYPLDTSYGAFFAHTVAHSKTDEALKKQTLWVEDCNIISHVGSRCMLISNSGKVEQENCFFTFIKNMVYNENVKNNSVFTSVKPSAYSYGNSNSELNFTV